MLARVIAREACRSSRSFAFRCYTIPTTQGAGNTPNLLNVPPPKKQKIDLRPAPIKPIQKPSPLSASKVPLSKPAKTNASTDSSTKLAAAKEEVQQAIHDAEAHGILKPPPPDANWFKRTLHTAIELLKFYYRGVKLIFTRRKHIATVKERVAAGGSPLTRAEFRLIQTQKDDIKKVVPFLIIAMLLEEVIPLIAIYAPWMLPSTCILPSQRQKIEEKRYEKAQTLAQDSRHIYAELKRTENPAGYLPLDSLSISGAPTAISGLLGLSTLGGDFLSARRIRRHLDFISKDDQLLLESGPDTFLTVRELKEALEERGMITKGLVHKDLQARLAWWLESVKVPSETIEDSAITRRLALVISSR
ncbi:hypothetical protein CPB83DRAFT_812685 [Crepidotus variabilis]|uniref:Letm1 RBD domain-containing protein n=1 Tax=Crepidotus variabilis TaxID=179855 RepID=A0A9P6EI23_9AGAR|nr:hypothetical protein CPB83DRAFT_812685 [Crepidotus variabilis]